MRYVFDENVGRSVLVVVQAARVPAVSISELCPVGTTDPELVKALGEGDVLVTYDQSMLGEHTASLIESRVKVVKLKGEKMKLAQRAGLFLLYEDELAREVAAATPPCVVSVSKAKGVVGARTIQRQRLPYGGRPSR